MERLTRRQARHAAKARRYTPLGKYFASEKAVEMGRRAIQLHGGSGYTKDYDAEKLLRDALVFPIYEGTSQIQALMAMKDTLVGATRRPQDFVRKAATARWRKMSARGLSKRVAALQNTSFGIQQHLLTRIAGGKFADVRSQPVKDWSQALSDWDPKRDFAPAMLHAERLTQVLVDVAVAEVLLEQTERDPAREELLERWLERAEPRVRHLQDVILNTGDRLLRSLEPDEDEITHDAAK